MNKLSGTGKLNQKRIATILDRADHTITVEEAATILAMSKKEIAKLMSRWVEQGWLTRIKRGLYVPVIKSDARNLPLKDPWVIATKIYSPCYVGALSAAEYWGFTKQKFSAINVLSTKKPRNRNPIINNSIHFSVRTISQQALFGLETVTRQRVDVLVSDPSRTIIDFLVDPQLGHGIYNVIDMLTEYLKTEYKNMDLLLEYAKRLRSSAVLQRLGFLLEYCKSGEFNTMDFCKMLILTGTVKLDPKMNAEKLITRWGLWVPRNFV